MPTYPVFASYAQADREKPLEDFIAEFRASLRSLLGRPDEKDIVFFDRESVKAGEKWDTEIIEAVGNAEVLVCLMSPTYLGREWCGRELEIFLRRSKQYGAAQPPPFIFPIWYRLPVVPRRLPPRLGQLQYRDAGFPRDYEKLGVRQLSRSRLLAQFSKLADRLAEVVAATLATAHRLPAAGPITKIEDVANAFDEEQPYDVRMLALTPGGGAWQPSATDATVSDAATKCAQRLQIFFRPLTSGPGLSAAALQAQAQQQVLLVVADVAAAPDAMAQTLNNLNLPNLAVLLVDGGTPPVGTQTWLGQVPDGAFAKAIAAGLIRVATAGAMQDEMERLVDETRRRLQAPQQVVRAEDPVLEARARDLGISTNLQPHLAGPGAIA